MPNNIIMADVKSQYRLLASGVYTNDTDAVNPMLIPVSYSGTPKAVFVGAVNGSALGGTYHWYSILDLSAVSDGIYETVGNATIEETTITVRRSNSASPIKAQDYKWFIYGK